MADRSQDAKFKPDIPELKSSRLIGCLVPVRLSLRPSRSIDFGDVSQTNGPE